jgi:hypothetical protein
MQSNCNKKKRKNFWLRKNMFEHLNENMPYKQPSTPSVILTSTNELGDTREKVQTLIIFIK